ncbi:mammalian cell entry protein [Mycobacterium sp. 852002-53434_SCH5985345]|uniref:mammalian cell entry protein n=1 Tax=unclassified Mycobacterium TaxID=2642494 RepID=UPI0007FD299C|nr:MULTISPECIES: mammalian cell entry protein [unclassified Mycobacterium]OBF56599.1 mammalian cell entry protein [Mycobacterium sp. 852002-53434_SCH5985345]OBF72182.1 mammalian cell entry protein [Mycobacterium sp. 852002-51613_SCH5001154]OBF93862.1 mammalian cell entry protein [Mycobacterium sp. 852014-52450_SCH5900713]
MEDQQPAAGDLAADGSAAAEEAATEERAESVDADKDSSAAAESTTDDAEAEPAETQPAGRKRRKWLAGKRLAITVVVAALLFVGSAAFAGAAVQPYLSDRAAAATKLKVARTAADAITTLWTYTPENMDTLADRASRYLSGDFEAQYRKFVDAIVAPNKQAKITNHTDVTGAAVETIDDANAAVIVYTNTTSTSPLTKNVPSLKYLSYRLFLKRVKSRWLVTRMTTITSLDLTPHV